MHRVTWRPLAAAVAVWAVPVVVLPAAAPVAVLARAAALAGDPAGAARHLGKAVEIDPRHATAHRLLADTLVGLNAPEEEAEGHYRQALAVNENDLAARVGLGSLLRRRGRAVEAEAEFRRVLDLDPTDPVARMLLEAPVGLPES